jgi:hypothetical protein
MSYNKSSKTHIIWELPVACLAYYTKIPPQKKYTLTNQQKYAIIIVTKAVVKLQKSLNLFRGGRRGESVERGD